MTQEGQVSVQEISDEDGLKFPALFGVRQIIKSDPEEARSQLIEVRESFIITSYISLILRLSAICFYQEC